MSVVLITHADQPLGRRITKALYHDDQVEGILAVGRTPCPRAFDRFRSGARPRLVWHQVDLAKHRPVSSLFHSPSFREMGVDTVIHVPCHNVASSDDPPLVAGLSARIAEARLVLQHCLEAPSVDSLIALGSAYVYKLQPGNANRLNEDSELDLDPDIAPELRSWIDCDMIFHAEVGNDRLRVALLRLPTVVASGGFVYLNPSLSGRAGARVRPLGFDPLCALISDKDVARAVQAAVHAQCSGVYNVAGEEAVPLSLLGRWTGRPILPVPGPLLGILARTASLVGADSRRTRIGGDHLRYGFSLDTERAEEQLGFLPAYRIGVSRAGDGTRRLETAPVA